MTDPTRTLASPNIDGGYVVSAAGGSGKSGIYMVQPKYQFTRQRRLPGAATASTSA